MLIKTSRRRFLAGLGAATLAAPFVNLLNKEAYAATTGGAKRLLVFFTPDGMSLGDWTPNGTGANFSFPAGSVLEPLAGVKDDLLVIGGLNFYGVTNHEGGMNAMLTNVGNGTSSATGFQSIDQYVAGTLASSHRFTSLELGVRSDGSWGPGVQTQMVYSGKDTRLSPQNNPSRAYEALFGDLTNPDADKRFARRQRMLDVARDDLNALHARLGREERLKLDQHLNSLEELERQFNPSSGDCSPGPDLFSGDSNSDADVPEVVAAQIDLAVSALACGLTPVTTIQLSHTVSNMSLPWLGISSEHHSLSHNLGSPGPRADFVAAQRWFAQQFADVIQKLKDTPDPENGGTMLDSTVVLWAKELGDPGLHTCENVPFVLAGNAGGFFNTGRYVNVSGQHHSRLLVSICNSLGIDIDQFGDPGAQSGALEELA